MMGIQAESESGMKSSISDFECPVVILLSSMEVNIESITLRCK